jgi:hypothetical protein
LTKPESTLAAKPKDIHIVVMGGKLAELQLLYIYTKALNERSIRQGMTLYANEVDMFFRRPP